MWWHVFLLLLMPPPAFAKDTIGGIIPPLSVVSIISVIQSILVYAVTT